MKQQKNDTKFGVIKVKSGTVILNNITFDEQTSNLLFDYTVDENISEKEKIKIEEELKEYFDKMFKEDFLIFIKDKVIK